MTPRAVPNIRNPFAETAEELYEQAPCGYLSAGPDGTILRANQKIAAIIGRPVHELVDRVRLPELLTMGSRIYYETHVSPLMLMQDHVDEIALDIKGPEGAIPVPVLLNAVLRRSSTGEPLGIRATMLDVTERRRYERELLGARNAAEEAAHRKSELISMISHDIRTPLGALITVAELMETTQLSENQAQYVRILKSSTGNLLRLINDVLDLGKLEAGHMRLERKPVDLRKLVEGIVGDFGLEAARKGLRLDADIDSTVPSGLLADAIKLGRILSNLVGNAIKFSDHGAVRVSVTLLRIDKAHVRVAFEVRDTGIGISEEQINWIFDDFTQGSDEIGSQYGGSGLGLGICQKFVALYGSELTVDSKLGQGSRFRFELNLERASPSLVVGP